MKKIYLIRRTDKNAYKIGKSKNPKKRIKQLQTANDSILELLYEFSSNYPDKLERFLHLHFHIKKMEGEWFELSNEQVLNFLNTCKEKEDLLVVLSDNYFFNKY